MSGPPEQERPGEPRPREERPPEPIVRVVPRDPGRTRPAGPFDDLVLAGIWFVIGGVGGLVLAYDGTGVGDQLLVPWQVVSQPVAASLTGACVAGGLAWAAARTWRLPQTRRGR
jgi:hypothetical protein